MLIFLLVTLVVNNYNLYCISKNKWVQEVVCITLVKRPAKNPSAPAQAIGSNYMLLTLLIFITTLASKETAVS